MTRRVAPPRLAELLVDLFTTEDQRATILGDLLEEFSDLALRSGTAAARRWYWRQALRSIAHLMRVQARSAPAQTFAFAVGGFILYAFAERALQSLAEAAAIHWDVYARLNVDAVAFWRVADSVGRYVLPVLVGWSIGRIARGRALVAACGVCASATIWMLLFYGSWLMVNLDIVRIFVPSLPTTLVFPPPGPPHGASIAHTLEHLEFALLHWWIPTTLLLVVGAAMSRAGVRTHAMERGLTQ